MVATAVGFGGEVGGRLVGVAVFPKAWHPTRLTSSRICQQKAKINFAGCDLKFDDIIYLDNLAVVDALAVWQSIAQKHARFMTQCYTWKKSSKSAPF